ncbi:MAG TPA: prepilin peptidase [Candidatus Polarisedimenticolia bacterium]|jgi:prepilin peptidase CpaA|nr:prepilin peptidase [Candidatus Polarisedimenticolia bacterium]
MEAKVLLYSIAILVAAVACITDLRSRRISNVLILFGLLSGLSFNLMLSGLLGLGWSLLGGLLGLAIFFPFFALGGLGAGDVKLLSCLGAILGPRDLLAVALVGAVIGGAMALIVALIRGRLLSTLRGVGELLAFWMSGGLKPSPVLSLDNPGTLKIPYAVPVAAGTFVVLLSRWS